MSKSSTASGLSLLEVLLVVFIVLKLCGVIDWSWWWVLSPAWGVLLLAVVIIAGAILSCGAVVIWDKLRFRDK